MVSEFSEECLLICVVTNAFVIKGNAKKGLMNKILYAYDLALMTKSRESENEVFKMEIAVRKQGLKVNLKKT